MQQTTLLPSSPPFQLSTPSIEVQAQWNLVNNVDLDLSCALYGHLGNLIDCAYYNQKVAQGVTHNGDTKVDLEGVDESLNVNLEMIGPEVKALVFTICCYKGGSFKDVKGFSINFVDYGAKSVVSVENPDCQLSDTGCITAILFRPSDHNLSLWHLLSVHVEVQARNFVDCHKDIQKVLGDYCNIDHVLIAETASTDQSKSFPLTKGEFFNLKNLKKIRVGLGWDTRCDVDSSIVLLNAHHKLVGTPVYFANRSFENSVSHKGDNTSGEGDGDDEVIDVDLEQLNPQVQSLLVIINIYSTSYTFKEVSGASVRLVDAETDNEICSYKLDSSEVDPNATAYVMARIYRHKSVDNETTWRIKALGLSSQGRRVSETFDYLQTKKVEVEEVRYTCTIELSDFQGKSLAAKDRGGTSDPYFIVFWDGKSEYKSKTINKTLNPIWSEQVCLKHVALNQANPVELKIEIWDKDLLSRDDFMGQIILTIPPVASGKRVTEFKWYDVQKRTPKDEVEGSIGFKYVVGTESGRVAAARKNIFETFE